MIVRIKSNKKPKSTLNPHSQHQAESIKLLNSGFNAFKEHLAQEFDCLYELNLEDFILEQELKELYQNGIPENWTLDLLKARSS